MSGNAAPKLSIESALDRLSAELTATAEAISNAMPTAAQTKQAARIVASDATGWLRSIPQGLRHAPTAPAPELDAFLVKTRDQGSSLR